MDEKPRSKILMSEQPKSEELMESKNVAEKQPEKRMEQFEAYIAAMQAFSDQKFVTEKIHKKFIYANRDMVDPNEVKLNTARVTGALAAEYLEAVEKSKKATEVWLKITEELGGIQK